MMSPQRNGKRQTPDAIANNHATDFRLASSITNVMWLQCEIKPRRGDRVLRMIVVIPAVGPPYGLPVDRACLRCERARHASLFIAYHGAGMTVGKGGVEFADLPMMPGDILRLSAERVVAPQADAGHASTVFCG